VFGAELEQQQQQQQHMKDDTSGGEMIATIWMPTTAGRSW